MQCSPLTCFVLRFTVSAIEHLYNDDLKAGDIISLSATTTNATHQPI